MKYSFNKALKQQSEELKVSNEELEEKSNYLERQKTEIEAQNSRIKVSRHEIKKKAEELEVVSKYKSEFLANMSHELRTPLNSMLILSKLFTDNTDGNLTEEQIEQAGIIYKGGHDLLNLINDILDLSKIEAGKMILQYEDIELSDIILSMKEVFNPIAEDKKLEFKVNVSKTSPKIFNTDTVRLKQILKNLLGNAFKFTEKGNVALNVFYPENDVVNGEVTLTKDKTIGFSITDTGIGIPDDKQKIIFEAFQQAEGSIQRRHGGTGLGLTISRELVRKLGGKFEMKSKLNKGSTFTIYLPINVVVDANTKQIEAVVASDSSLEIHRDSFDADNMKFSEGKVNLEIQDFNDDRKNINSNDEVVLIIEDDSDFSTTILGLVRKRNFKGIIASGGKEGIQLALQYNPSGIILDLGLPDIQGEMVLKRLKANLKTRHIPIHIISAHELNSELLNKGAVGYLEKPVSSDQVFDAIEKIHKIHNASIKQVLVIEDDSGTQKAITNLLKRILPDFFEAI
jgi:signal transduction histidine kinase/CheY-like chemotaxis protein